MLKNSRISAYYSEELSYSTEKQDFSESPDKPTRLIEFLDKNTLLNHFKIIDSFPCFDKEDFYIAHKPEWVDNFFAGTGKLKKRSLLGIQWTKAYAESVMYSNSSLYHAIRHSIQKPSEVCFSPTSGFHHATPKTGALFCAFSGQVIASYKLYKEFGLSGCYVDLDGHWGNSIECSYEYVPELEKAIPPEIGNINIDSDHSKYIAEFGIALNRLKEAILKEKIHYVVFCHGADSHEWDDLGRQLTTEEWIYCAELFYSFFKDVQNEIGRQIPLTLCLFGGYRKDDFNSVLSLHTADLVSCLNILCGQSISYLPVIKQKPKIN